MQSVLGFCMEEAGSKERADSIFNFVLSRNNITYWPIPTVDPALRGNLKLKQVAFKHSLVPVKITKHMLLICGTNPYNTEGILEIYKALEKNPYPVFVLSEPSNITEPSHNLTAQAARHCLLPLRWPPIWQDCNRIFRRNSSATC